MNYKYLGQDEVLNHVAYYVIDNRLIAIPEDKFKDGIYYACYEMEEGLEKRKGTHRIIIRPIYCEEDLLMLEIIGG